MRNDCEICGLTMAYPKGSKKYCSDCSSLMYEVRIKLHQELQALVHEKAKEIAAELKKIRLSALKGLPR